MKHNVNNKRQKWKRTDSPKQLNPDSPTSIHTNEAVAGKASDNKEAEKISFLEMSILEKEGYINKLKDDFEKNKESYELNIDKLETEIKETELAHIEALAKLEEDYKKESDELLELMDLEIKSFEKDLEKKDLDLNNTIKNKERSFNNKKIKLESDYKEKERNLSNEFLKKQEQLETDIKKKATKKWMELEGFLSAINSQIAKDHEKCNVKVKELLINLGKDVLDTYEKALEVSASKIAMVEDAREALEKEIMDAKQDFDLSIEEIDNFTKETSKAIGLDFKMKNHSLKMYKSELKEEVEKTDIIEIKKQLREGKAEKRFQFFKDLNLEKPYKWVNSHKALSFLISVISMTLIVVTLLGIFLGKSYYKLNPEKVINASINKIYTQPSYKSNSILYFDGESQAIDAIRDSVIFFEKEFNEETNETYQTYTLSGPQKEFSWERFIKNDLKVIKTPYESQYIQVENFRDYGFKHNYSEYVDFFKKPLGKLLASTKRKEYSVIDKQEERLFLPNGLLGYLKHYTFGAESTSYYYEINLDEKKSNDFFKTVVSQVIGSDNFKSFILEEKTVHEKLKLEDGLVEEIEKLAQNMMTNTKATASKIEVAITEDSVIESIGFHFELNNLIEGAEPFSLHFVTSFEGFGEVENVERQIFSMNSMKFNEIFPRLEIEDFKDSETVPIIENTSTLKDMEKTHSIDFNPSQQEEGVKVQETTPDLDISVETDVDLQL